MQEPPSLKEQVRIAHVVRHQLGLVAAARLSAVDRQVAQLLSPLDRLSVSRRKLDLSVRRGWSAAASKAVGQIETAVRDVPFHVEQVARAVREHRIRIPSVRDVVDDLGQLKKEFVGLSYRPEHVDLAVVTDPIELDDVYLGEFEIRLRLDRIAEQYSERAYSVVALDPHPAASNSSVTHPHVSDETLCAGDAVTAIRTALAGGRLADFFLLVRSVLTNYNPGSPYVALDHWYGRPCYNCADTMGSDDARWCSACDNDFCDACASYCCLCDETACTSCLTECAACGDNVCPSCRVPCGECGVILCRTCRDQRACPCHEEEQDHEKDQEQTPTESPSVPSGVPAGEAA